MPRVETRGVSLWLLGISLIMIIEILFLLLLGFTFGFIWRNLLKLLKNKNLSLRAKMNIGKPDKLIRWTIGFALLFLGIKWGNSWYIFFAGFSFFEAIFSWCGFYALLGRNTCDI